MNNINVLMIGPALDMKGGISAVSKTLMDSEFGDNLKIIYISSYIDGTSIDKIKAAIWGLFKMLLMLITKKIDIVHIHAASRGSFRRKINYFLLAKIFNKKVIYHIHGAEFMLYFDEVNSIEKRIITKLLENVDQVIALSNNWKKDLKSIAPKAKIEVIHNPVNVSTFCLPNKNRKNINVLFMGRLGERKGIYDLLSVISTINKRHKHVFFHLCGDGDVEKVKDIVIKNNMEKNVFIPGWINLEQKLDYFAAGSIYILPSYNEGLPISILEAMASSLPIIATNVGGIPEAVEHKKNGYLVLPGDKLNLEKYLLLLIENEELRNELGEYSFKKCNEYFDINIVKEKIKSIYSEII